MCGRVPAFALLVLLLWPGRLAAQEYTHLSGLISDPSGAAVPRASITVLSQETGFRRETVTDSHGWYSVPSLTPGHYKVTVRREGFRTLIRFGLKLDVAQPLQLDFVLRLGSIQEVVTVTDAPTLLNTSDASVGTLIPRDRIENLPLNGRGLLSLLEMAPGAIVTPATRGESGQFTANGQRPNANYFLVDGVSANTGITSGAQPARATGGSLPGLTALGSLHGLGPVEGLQEFRVQTSTSAPEFGKLPGAQVLLSSRAGSNQWHGAIGQHLRSGILDASDWFQNRERQRGPKLLMSDTAGHLGGPLLRDRTFFFASYEGLRLGEPFPWRAATPTSQARASAGSWALPALDLFPLPNGQAFNRDFAEWTGIFERNSGLQVGSLRIDHAVTSRLTVFSRYNRSASSTDFSSLQVNRLALGSGSLTVGANWRLPRITLDLRMNRSSAGGASEWIAGADAFQGLCSLLASPPPEGQSCAYQFRVSIAGVGQAAAGLEPEQRQTQWHILPTATLSAGNHRLYFGADLRRYGLERRDRAGAFSLIAEDLRDFVDRRFVWKAYALPRSVSSSLSENSAFLQDTWRVSPRTTATFGLRWASAQAPLLSDGQQAPAYVFPGQSQVWSRSKANLAPRAGIAIQPFPNSRFVLRGGWGVYFDSTLSIATDLINGGPFSLTQFLNGRNGLFSTLLSYGFEPGLRLPRVSQWNVSAETPAAQGVLTASYVGANGDRLLRRELGPLGDSQTLWLALATGNGRSNYHGLQLQYRRPLSARWQAQAGYSWSHSIDNSSSDSLLHRTGSDFDRVLDRGSSDFDVRHSLTAAFGYQAPDPSEGASWRNVYRGWSIDGIFRARTGFPISVLTSEYAMGVGFANAFRPGYSGRPAWISDAHAPGGRRLNPAAFSPVPPLTQGSLGRNALRGFGMHQLDLSLRRSFTPSDGQELSLRAEIFNLFNHPNFADPIAYLSSPLFGESTTMLNRMLGTGSPASGLTPAFQTGGARSIQLGLRYRF